MAKYENLVPRFIKYAKVNTRSNEESTTVPSDPKEVAFLADLATELKTIGLQNVRTMKDGYVFAELASNIDKDVPTIGFISHVDTADFNSENVQPQIHENYDGKSDLKLSDEWTLSQAEFPNMKNYEGHTLITSDGSTLLGADDKAGVAEIIAAMEYLIANPDVKHGTIKVAFGPDEEIGIGADNFDTKEFGADFAYTVDGGPLGELEWETFNAADAKISVQGKNVHPGSAKDTMINAIQVVMDFHAALPEHDRPEHTEGTEGFWHVMQIGGSPEAATIRYIVRDHDRQKFEERKQLLLTIADKMNADFGTDRINVEIKDQYFNMGEVLKDDMRSVDLAANAMKALDIKPLIEPVRGGTDGSKITFLGTPTPNLFAGGENMHSRFEFVSAQVMEQAVDTLLKISELNIAD
ncbi:peptidase T [Periweissella ghanensis]|uniref:Peptidase T n=1 Tax=Periweissella ghanensis TaxID=467997 RepID=A0ABM8ZA16_9LACO|nr:peptidase T [Periweissella ghanensis]MCM0601752.1 peptidase T [Periweissella ghanensis]CAH0418184.1 Peptidase T [Periweissella ghanensis]